MILFYFFYEMFFFFYKIFFLTSYCYFFKIFHFVPFLILNDQISFKSIETVRLFHIVIKKKSIRNIAYIESYVYNILLFIQCNFF